MSKSSVIPVSADEFRETFLKKLPKPERALCTTEVIARLKEVGKEFYFDMIVQDYPEGYFDNDLVFYDRRLIHTFHNLPVIPAVVVEHEWHFSDCYRSLIKLTQQIALLKVWITYSAEASDETVWREAEEIIRRAQQHSYESAPVEYLLVVAIDDEWHFRRIGGQRCEP